MVVSRQVLAALAVELPKMSPEAHKEVAQFALQHIQPRVVSFEEQVGRQERGKGEAGRGRESEREREGGREGGRERGK